MTVSDQLVAGIASIKGGGSVVLSPDPAAFSRWCEGMIAKFGKADRQDPHRDAAEALWDFDYYCLRLAARAEGVVLAWVPT